MSSIRHSIDDHITNFTNFYNGVINHRLYIGTMTEEDAKILRNMLARIQTDPELLKAIRTFNKSLLYLNDNWTTGVSLIYDDDTITSIKLISL